MMSTVRRAQWLSLRRKSQLLQGYMICMLVFAAATFLVSAYFYLEGRPANDAKANAWRSRFSKEQYAGLILNSFASNAFTDAKAISDQVYAIQITPKQRVVVDVSRSREEHLNEFLAFVVDFVTSSHDAIVPIVSLRRLSSVDSRLLNRPDLEGEIVTFSERPGGILTLPTDVCATYKCPRDVFDPITDEDACELGDARKTRFASGQLDHLFVLDFLTGNIGKKKRSGCTVVPDRSRPISLLLADQFEGCCCSSTQTAALITNAIWLDKSCNLSPRVVERYSPFWPKAKQSFKGKTLGELVRAFLRRDSLPISIKDTVQAHDACISEFQRHLNERLDVLMDFVTEQCPDRREALADDYRGRDDFPKGMNQSLPD